MAATFKKNKSKIQAVLEHNLAVVVPKLHSVGLTSDEDRDLALNSSIDSKTRAAVLINVVERKIANYRNWWILVYILLSSELDVERTFFESLVVLPEQVSGDAHSTSVDTAMSLSHSPALETQSQPPSTPSETVLSSSGATSSEPTEGVLSQEGNAHIQHTLSLESSVWHTHARDFPGIKFSNYYTKEVVTSMGNIIKGEGIELQIPGRAIKKGHSIEFMIHGCIEGPFEMPDKVSLATPVFLIKPHYEFQRKITVLIDSFISLDSPEDRKELVFLMSPARPRVDKDGPHWDFTINETIPQSTEDNSRIMVEVTQFCLFCFGIRRGNYISTISCVMIPS